MRLDEYLTQTSASRAEFAQEIGVSVESVRRYLAGERIPDREIMVKIALATDGQVTANDFFGLAA
jgi:transcriptional regulator with XRE-family HTH domain